jgi:hypothetical protein
MPVAVTSFEEEDMAVCDCEEKKIMRLFSEDSFDFFEFGRGRTRLNFVFGNSETQLLVSR